LAADALLELPAPPLRGRKSSRINDKESSSNAATLARSRARNALDCPIEGAGLEESPV
jgi:hypothetical protein